MCSRARLFYPRSAVIALDVDIFFLLYLGAGFCLILGLALYYDRRDAHRYVEERHRVLYHCIKCGQIYIGPYRSIECKCPECGFTNGRLSF